MSALARPDAIEIATVLGELNALGSFLRLTQVDPLCAPDADAAGWMAESDLARIDVGPQARIIEKLGLHGFGGSRRALSASVMLRYGWASGVLIGPWLMRGHVIRDASLALRFSPNAVLVEAALRSHRDILTSGDAHEADLRRQLSHELAIRAAPIVEAHHEWSGFSRKALWSMVTSSWAAQFIHIGERLGDPERGLAAANDVLNIDPAIAAASPDLYMVRAEGKRGVCQMRRLCCLWFRSPQRPFCSSCPIIPADDRLARNRAWIAQHGLPDNERGKRA